MMKKEIELLNYQELLDILPAGKSHLLLGNGFNLSLGIKTSYYEIFNHMKELYPDYNQIDDEFKTVNCDIEQLIGNINNNIIEDSSKRCFLNSFIQNKIKADFMKATVSIVTKKIKEVYHEDNEEIYLLFEKFNDYFTLNFDPFLYLLLMKFKKTENNQAVAFQTKIKFKNDSLSNEESALYKIIERAYNQGELYLKIENESIVTPLNKLIVPDLKNQITKIFKSKAPNTNDKTLKKITKIFIENINTQKRILDINDGFEGTLFNNNSQVEDYSQNLFFLHGAFHIYQDGKLTKKITQSSEKSLNQRMEEIIESEEKEIICIFRSNDKIIEINNDPYLLKAYNKLSDLEGEMVIFGCALSNNDNHIFSKINKNKKIGTIYISTNDKQKGNAFKNANKIFTNKKLVFFDYDTVTYKNNK